MGQCAADCSKVDCTKLRTLSCDCCYDKATAYAPKGTAGSTPKDNAGSETTSTGCTGKMKGCASAVDDKLREHKPWSREDPNHVRDPTALKQRVEGSHNSRDGSWHKDLESMRQADANFDRARATHANSGEDVGSSVPTGTVENDPGAVVTQPTKTSNAGEARSSHSFFEDLGARIDAELDKMIPRIHRAMNAVREHFENNWQWWLIGVIVILIVAIIYYYRKELGAMCTSVFKKKKKTKTIEAPAAPPTKCGV